MGSVAPLTGKPSILRECFIRTLLVLELRYEIVREANTAHNEPGHHIGDQIFGFVGPVFKKRKDAVKTVIDGRHINVSV